MQAQDTEVAARVERGLEVEYTDRRVSGWGGLVALERFFERVGLREVLRGALPDGRTSPNQIPVLDIVLSLFGVILTGGSRFAHVERLRGDSVVGPILGIAEIPSAVTLTRYLGAFSRAQVEHMDRLLSDLIVGRLGLPERGMVIDLDSTVIERHGNQEGSLKGYNPRRRGRPSHHPLLAMLAEAKVVLGAWLRSGNTGSARGVCEFLAESLGRLPEGFKISGVRADSGFFVTEFLDFLEERKLPYAIVARMTPLLKRQIVCVHAQHWHSLGDGLSVTDFEYQAPNWHTPRRIVAIREEIRERPDARGRKLIDVPGYAFRAIATSLPHFPEDVWRFYNERADCENRIKELKEDFAVSGFCLQSFDGMEAAFRLACFLFNLIADFKRCVLQDARPRLATLRTNLLVIGATLGSSGRKRLLRLGLKGAWRQRFQAILASIAALPSTAAQLQVLLSKAAYSPPQKWRLRPRASRRQPLGLAQGWSFN